YKLWKPYLRAVMERDMKSVSEGTKSKAEVLDTSLQQMKACFLDVSCSLMKCEDQIELAARSRMQLGKLFDGVDFAKNQIWC
ncbi:DNA topoisomerase 3-alpha-like, partial [Trifolium medium]|nr:DNA topoisomerase 3-alpha-like [Trifolium medium]